MFGISYQAGKLESLQAGKLFLPQTYTDKGLSLARFAKAHREHRGSSFPRRISKDTEIRRDRMPYMKKQAIGYRR